MRLLLNVSQLQFAMRGMRAGERTQRIAERYFIEGESKSVIANVEGITVQHVSRVISDIEKNFKRILTVTNRRIEILIVPND